MTTRRIIVRNTLARDGVGSPEDVAYGEGYHAQRGEVNPYGDKLRSKAWERGKQASKNAGKVRANYYKGELRNKSFEVPQRDAAESDLTGAYERGMELGRFDLSLGEAPKNPYPAGSGLAPLWELGYKNGRKIRKQRTGGRDHRDYKSERGYVAKVLGPNGSVLAQSPEAFISERSARNWLTAQIANFAKFGRHVTGSVAHVFFDPAYAQT